MDSKKLSSTNSSHDDCSVFTGKICPHGCEQVLVEICKAQRASLPITIWDLPKLTGLSLHEAFASVRTLEFGKLINISDNPSDPFGARLSITAEAADRLQKRNAA